MKSARGVAFSVLLNVFENASYSNIALDKALRESDLSALDKAFATNIVYGVLTNLSYLDYQIKSYSKIPLKKLSEKVKTILRISLYQMIFMDKVPGSAAVNEGVKLTKKQAFKSSGFVNAVLRAFIREGKKLPPKDDAVKYLSLLYSYPEWIVEKWISYFGEDECEKLLEAGNMTPPLTVRVNESKITKEELKKRLSAEDGAAESALNLTKRGSVSDMEEFKEGLFTVQDAAAQRAVLTLAPQKGDKVLDMCAAPGGKTTHIAELIGNEGEVCAWDIYAHKIKLIEDAAKRLSLSNIKAYVHNGKEPKEEFFGYFDKVLLDAPCSGLGIIRRKPDIKWSRKEEDIAEIVKEQETLLDIAANYVKRGGCLLYSTCTLNKEENEDMVSEFLKKHADFEMQEKILLCPHKDNTDGFFISLMKREK
ncbi:MAG: 16S rRNA (cytosine(967)-C(5))-methyltransferase RsmB [Clostridia bacterium]|nr:16S rRNA (cytosine(967)-C(5))-methyltransferase RsmB [Clostridia bacterium]